MLRPSGANYCSPTEEDHRTRTVSGGADLAVAINVGVRSFVKRKVPTQFTPGASLCLHCLEQGVSRPDHDTCVIEEDV